MRTLVNDEATHEAVVRAFDEHLLRRAGPETEVLFWFSGHGSRVPDQGGEREELDSTFLCADSRLDGRLGEYDLVDDEFNCLLRALMERTPHVVVVTDSCHSGGGMRGESELVARSVPAGRNPLEPQRLEDFWPEGIALETGELDPERYLHIAACAPNQLAFEHAYQDLDGNLRRQGALSFFLLDGLEHCAPGTTWRQLADEAAVRVATRYPAQTVWYEGALERKVFGGGFAAPPAGFLGRHFGSRVTLEAGRLHGLQRGTRLEVRANLAGPEEAPLGEIEVYQVEAGSAAARWVEAPDGLELGTPLRAAVVGRPAASHPLRVHASPALAQLLDEDYAEPADYPETAQLFLTESELGLLQLRDASSHRIWSEPAGRDSTRADALSHALRRELLRQSIFRLPDEPGSLKVEARFRPPTEVEARRFAALPVAHIEPLEHGARGEMLATGGPSKTTPTLTMLELRNADERPLHVMVFSLPESRRYDTVQLAVEPIWPVKVHLARENRIEPGGRVHIPVGLVASDEWDLDRPLRDRYLVIATPEWHDFSSFLTDTRGSSGSPALPGPLSRAFAKRATRGVQLAPASEELWGIQAVDLLVERAEPDAEPAQLSEPERQHEAPPPPTATARSRAPWPTTASGAPRVACARRAPGSG